jgi:hypothetical protein
MISPRSMTFKFHRADLLAHLFQKASYTLMATGHLWHVLAGVRATWWYPPDQNDQTTLNCTVTFLEMPSTRGFFHLEAQGDPLRAKTRPPAGDRFGKSRYAADFTERGAFLAEKRLCASAMASTSTISRTTRKLSAANCRRSTRSENVTFLFIYK